MKQYNREFQITVYGERSCDRKSIVNIHCKDQLEKWFQINVHLLVFPSNLFPLTVNIHRNSSVVKEMLDQHTWPFSCTDLASMENDLLIASISSIQFVVFAHFEMASEMSAMSW